MHCMPGAKTGSRRVGVDFMDVDLDVTVGVKRGPPTIGGMLEEFLDTVDSGVEDVTSVDLFKYYVN